MGLQAQAGLYLPHSGLKDNLCQLVSFSIVRNLRHQEVNDVRQYGVKLQVMCMQSSTQSLFTSVA